jgi:hypothetical protein
MARRRGRGDSRMGVGGAAGPVEYGERQIVESTAMTPTSSGPPAGPTGQQGGPMLGAAVQPFAPTERPDQSITAGLAPGDMMGPDPADMLAAMYRRFPYPDLRRLLERAQMTDYRAMAQQQPTGGMGGMESMMDPAAMATGQGGMTRGQQADAARLQGQADRMLPEGSDPDQSSSGPAGRADVESRMGDIRDSRTGGRFG